MSHSYRIKVRGFHCDLYGHVNNARYLEFLEEARWDLVETAPRLATLGDQGLGFIVASINIEYKRPVGLGEVVEIRSEITDFATKRAVMRQEVFNLNTGKTSALAQVTFAIIDLTTGRSVPLDAERRAWFSASGDQVNGR